MSEKLQESTALPEQFTKYLSKKRYHPRVIKRYTIVTRRFLLFLEQKHIQVTLAQPQDIERYLERELKLFHQHHARAPLSQRGWKQSHTSGIHEFMRMIIGQWPPVAGATTPAESYVDRLCKQFTQWLVDERALAATTICDLANEAQRFLFWYLGRSNTECLLGLQVADIDAYLQERSISLRRPSLKGVSQRLRCFMRFAHASGNTARDFAPSVMSPTLYAFESIPSVLSTQEISAILQATRKDNSLKGVRDYAILLFLSTYGLRAGEITQMQLDDIDWRANRFCVRHTKTAAQSSLPLLANVGEALLEYLQRARPDTHVREIFIRTRAPYQGFDSGSSLYTPIRRRIEEAGVQPKGKCGPHTFRHARAVSLLRADVAPKVIADVLGHRCASSIMAYLKLQTEDLRTIALEIPSLQEAI